MEVDAGSASDVSVSNERGGHAFRDRLALAWLKIGWHSASDGDGEYDCDQACDDD